MLGSVLDHVFDGDREVLANMRSDVRRQYLDDHADAIAELCASIPILSYASRVGPGDPSLLAKQAALLKLATGLDNDGVVPEEGAILKAGDQPCGHHIRASGISHLAPVTEDRFGAEPGDGQAENGRQKLFAALLKLWLTS